MPHQEGHPLVATPAQTVHGMMRGEQFISDDDAMMEMQIKRMAAQAPDPQRMASDRMTREQDPGGRQKALAATQQAIAGSYASQPPVTPTITDPSIPDYWADWRELSGVEGPKPQKGQQPAKATAPAMPSEQAITNPLVMKGQR